MRIANGDRGDTGFENQSLATASARQKQHSDGVGRHYCYMQINTQLGYAASDFTGNRERLIGYLKPREKLRTQNRTLAVLRLFLGNILAFAVRWPASLDSF